LDFQALYELADRELNVGLADDDLLERSLAEAKGMQALARQIYCERRAKQLKRDDASTSVEELVALVQLQEKRLRARKERNRWLWAGSSFVGFVAAIVSSWFALAAAKHESRFYPLALLALLSFVFTIVSIFASRYHTNTEE
jgi:hypothetical protein